MVHPQIVVQPRIIVTHFLKILFTKLLVVRSIIRGNTVYTVFYTYVR